MRGERSKRTASKAGTRPRRVRLCGRRREGSGCGLGAGRATHGVLPPALRAPPLGGGRLRRGLSPNASPNASPKVSLFLTERHGTAVSFRVVLWLRIFEKHSKAGTRPRRARLCGRFVEMSLPRQPANLPTCKPANLPTCKPANLPTCKPANLPTCDPATPRTKKRAARIFAIRAALEEKPWRRATLPRPIAAVPSPLGPFTSVFGMGTGVASPPWPPGKRDGRRERPDNRTGPVAPKRRWGKNAQASRTISTGRVSASPRLRLRPIEVVVFHRP